MSKGRFGVHGGQYIPETLMNAVLELEEAYNHYKNDPVELRVIFIMIVGFLQFQNRIHQRLWNILSAVYSKSTF